MKRKTTHPFQRLHRCSLGMFFFVSLVLMSCSSEERENWTAVQQEGEYIYGVWHSATMKRAGQMIQKVSENVKSASIPSEESLNGKRPSANRYFARASLTGGW